MTEVPLLTQYPAMALGLLGAVFIAYKKRNGFIFWIINNALWVIFGWTTKSYGLLIQFAIFFFISIHGYIYWGKHGG